MGTGGGTAAGAGLDPVLLRAVIDALDEGIALCDPRGETLLVNRAMRNVLGTEEPGPVTGWSQFVELFERDGVTPVPLELGPMRRALRGEVVTNAHVVVRSRNGTRTRRVVVNGRPVESAGELLGIVATVRDVTDAVNADERLRESEAFLESLVENIPNMIFVKDAEDLRFVRFNRAGEELLGHPREGLLGKNDFDFFPREQAEQFISADRAVLAGGGMVDIPEEPLTAADGGLRTLHTKKIPLRDANGIPRYLLGISEDITERREAEARRVALLVEQGRRSEVERTNDGLRTEREIRERFINALSHDLRGPLSTARVTAQMIQRAPDRTDRVPALTARIVRQLDRAERMLTDLLDVQRIRAGETVPITIEPCDLGALVRETVDDLGALHAGRFELHCPPSVAGWWSRDGLRRAIENLATNAVKYGALDRPVVISVCERATGVTVAVHNHGDPIPEHEHAKLFEPFARARGASDSGQKGWGIGLALVKGIVEAQRGVVSLASVAGEGTTFTIHLPLDAR